METTNTSKYMNGILSYLKAVHGIGKYSLLKYFIFSGIISLFIASGVTSISVYLGDILGDWIQSVYPWDKGSGIIGSIGDWTSGIVVFVLGLFLLKYLLLIIVSPIMSYMSESIERQMNDSYQSPKLTITNLISDLLRSLRINLLNLSKELLITLVLIIVSFFPGAAIVTTPLIFIVQAYYAGFGILDYWMERHYKVSDSFQFVKDHRLNAIGLGAVYLALLLIPIIGAVIAPVLGATAATIYGVERSQFISS